MKLMPLFLLLFLASCADPFQGMSKLTFQEKAIVIDPLQEGERMRVLQEAERERRRLLAVEKELAWKKIESNALEGFKDVRATLEKKCFACHDLNTKTPIYGRILTQVNPIYQHRQDGIKALDFSMGFPLLAQGNPSQVALLKAIRNEVLDRTMPLKLYTRFYPKRKINPTDEDLLVSWTDSLIKEIEHFEATYQNPVTDLNGQVKKVFEAKCFRCHANGSARGNFGDMQDTASLLKSRFVNLAEPNESSIYKLSLDQKMPPNKRDSLNDEELMILSDWLESQKSTK